MTTLTFHTAARARWIAPKLRSVRVVPMLKRIGKGVLAVTLFALLVTALAWIRVAHYMPALWH